MIGVKMGSKLIPLRFFTQVYNRLAQALCKSGLPIRAFIFVRQISKKKRRLLNAVTHKVVDYTCLHNFDIVYSVNLKITKARNSWLHYFFNKTRNIFIAK